MVLVAQPDNCKATIKDHFINADQERNVGTQAPIITNLDT